MDFLCESRLAQPLLAFAFAYYLLVIIGAEIRKHNPAFKGAVASLKNEDFLRVKTNKYFRLISLGFVTVITCFALYPHVYGMLIPIPPMSNQYYNLLGIVLMIVSMIKMVLVQTDADVEMHQSNLRDQAISYTSLMHFTKRMMTSYVTMFLGFTLVLTNCATILLLMVAAILYKRIN